jgi:zinc transport system substrate-binding protein
MNPTLRARWPLLVVLILVGVGCERAPAPRTKPLVVASFYPLYEFARQVAGDRAEVVSLVPAGVEPHDWEPTPQDVARARQASLFVYNGADLEPWAATLVKNVGGAGLVVVNATAGLALLPAEGPGHEDDHGKGEEEPAESAEAQDPHVWLDPVLAQAQVEAIRAGLVKADPNYAEQYAGNARAYQERLAALHAAFEAGLRRCARREIVVSHAAFAYLAKRYRLTMVPVAGLAPEAEPSPAHLASLVRFARRHKVEYIFFETLVSPKLAETLAREVGARTLVLNPIEGLTPEEAAAGKDYVALMEQNLQNLRTALACR